MSTGQLVSRANADISLVIMVLRVLPILASNLVMMVASLVVMFVFSPLLALISLVIAARAGRRRVPDADPALPGHLGHASSAPATSHRSSTRP